MRLTLRNLLNYMDDMLDPNDAAEIRKKVEESQFASDLLQRTRTVVGRMRLGAPKVEGRGMGVDANTVSDYLDHVLDSDQVQEFEKVCLESDVHLAEVAGCHQILALVLGEPATVDPTARDRMYQLKALRHDKPAAETAAAADATETEAKDAPQQPAKSPAAKAAKRDKVEVPDYLRDRRRMPLWSVAATILIAAALGAGLWILFDPNNPITAWFKGGDDAGDVVNPPGTPDDEPLAPRNDEPIDPVIDNKTPQNPTVSGEPGDQPGAAKPDVTDPDSKNPGTANPGTGEPGTQPDTKKPDHIQLPVRPTVPEDPPKVPDPDAGLIPPPPGDTKKPDGTDDPKTVVDPASDPDKQPANVGPAEVGRFISTDQLLVRKDKEDKDWFLVPVRDPLITGDRVLALPMYRPTITLSAGVTLQVPGGSSLEFLAPDASGAAGVRLHYGRLVVLNNGGVGTKFRIELGDGTEPREGVISFAGPASTAAIEVHRELKRGDDPEDDQTPLVAELCASGGQIVWEEGAGEEIIREQINPNAHIELRSDEAPKRLAASGVFAWLESDNLNKRDLLALPDMSKHLEPSRSVVLGLKELAAHRKFEVRSLAVRSLGYLGYFEPLVASFDDSEQRANWQANFENLRESLARGPAVASQMREAFERRRGDEAKDLYRMVWSYSPAQLESGSAEQLVKDLMHDDLDYRVLAFRNLMEITGVSLLYFPQDSARKRMPRARRWKEKLDAGEIKYSAKRA